MTSRPVWYMDDAKRDEERFCNEEKMFNDQLNLNLSFQFLNLFLSCRFILLL